MITGAELIPRPQQLETRSGELRLTGPLALSGLPSWRRRVQRILGRVLDLDETSDPGAEGPGLELVDDGRTDAGYRLGITEAGVRLSAGDEQGLAVGLATLGQLLPAWAAGPARPAGEQVVLPLLEIDDHPVLGWRGLHVDVARHFQPYPALLQLVDQLHAWKFNVLHLHLVDDQGWRLPVPGLPRLTEMAAVRTETVRPWDDGDGIAHGGYYTAGQLRALVAYAADRGITVVPEVDVPGHARALLHAYPEFGEPGPPAQPVATGFGVFDEVLHLSNECVAAMETIFDTVLEIFDSAYVHIGGDECPRTQWRASTAAAELAAERGLSGVDDLQRWLNEHLRGWLAERGRSLVGWDEIVEGADVPGAVVMTWRGRAPAVDALSRGYQVVLAPGGPLYLDHYQDRGADEPAAFNGLNSLADVAGYDPFEGLDEQQRALVLGVQGQLWSEYLPTPQAMQYAAFPRALALAEVAWTGAPAAADLVDRLPAALERLDAAGVEYRPMTGPRPWQVGRGTQRRPAGHLA